MTHDLSHPQQPTSSISTHALSPDGSPVPVHWVENLFDRLAAILGDSMARVWAGADPDRVKAEWAEALASFSSDEVKRGLAACRTRKFAPNLGEFLHLCRPALDPEFGWIEAERGMRFHASGERFAWSHPAVYWAACEMAHEIRAVPFAQVRKRWEALLAESFTIGKWPAIPDPTARRITNGETRPVPTLEEFNTVQAMLRATREKLTGYRTKTEQEEADRRATMADSEGGEP